ncbi:potassium transporter Trk [Microbacterium sp. gxy059]|uniref:potassium transporter Trk n=1 Tax=Microbacterium sp. gxy059 TaxID=2957199 RepID=UPI003D97065E
MAGKDDADRAPGLTPPEREPQGRPVAEVVIRRSPKYGVFTALGVALGIVAALVLTTVFDGTTAPSPYTEVTYSPSQAFGFILLWCIPAGIAIMMILALVLDRVQSRRVRRMRASVENVDER